MTKIEHEIAVSTWSLQQLSIVQDKSLEDLIPILAGMGISAIEINEDYSLLPAYRTSARARRELRARLAGAGLRAASTWFHTDLLGGLSDGPMSEVVAQMEARFEIAADFGTEVVTITPVDPSQDMTTERGMAEFKSIFAELIPLARSYGLVMGLETARSQGVVRVPQFINRLVNAIDSPELTVVPDFEAWRFATADLPLTHVEDGDEAIAPARLGLFEACLPRTRVVHAKLLRLDKHGDEPHFPVADLMAAVRRSSRPHILDIEYEGWIPDIDPHLDCINETRRCVELIRKHLSAGAEAHGEAVELTGGGIHAGNV